jgi:2-C-methyl-D-erythritol 2,4-cyclodiphosphate synthase
VIHVGFGYDIHVLESGRPFVLGGVLLDCPFGPRAHSDGDALIHALIDALLGASALGDIGGLFPPNDPTYQGISSLLLLEKTLYRVKSAGFRPVNADCSVVLETPRLDPYSRRMRETLAAALGIELESVSVKAKTKEGLDATGSGGAVEAYAVVLLERVEGAGQEPQR